MSVHKTLHQDVLGYVDSEGEKDDIWFGWCFHKTQGVLPLRAVFDNKNVDLTEVQREDVYKFYNDTRFKKSGWSIKLKDVKECSIEMKIDSKWIPIFILNVGLNTDTVKNSLASFVVVDNFYKDPYSVRKFALQQDFKEGPQYHKGKRSINSEFRFPGLKERFEEIIGCKIKNWDLYGVNGCFQYCVASDLAVYHHDHQTYAGVLFLTPDAPPETGTRLYRSRITKKMKVDEGEQKIVFKNGFYDSTQFEQVDVVGNVFNRLVLFDAKIIHAAPLYFGNTIENSRLFQLFFFDVDNLL
jgi:Family of unknown function (DUF6445)